MEKRRKNRIILSHRYSAPRFRRKKTGSSQINADSLLTMPDIGSGMESYRNFIGISKISAYGGSNPLFAN